MNTMLVKKKLLFVPILFGFCFLLLAQQSSASDYHSPRTTALGGAGHAGPLLNDSVMLNPSFTSFLPTYSIGLNYLTFNGPPGGLNSSPLRGRSYNISIQDGRNRIFQAGAAYTKREDGSMVHVSASRAVLKQLAFGVSGKFYFADKKRSGTGRDMSVSTSWIVSNFFQTALIADNLFQSESNFAHTMYREYILGLKFNLNGILLVYFDPHITPNAPSNHIYGFEGGLEFVFFSDLFVRLGVLRNATIPYLSERGKAYGLGFGWVAPRISLDFGLSRALDPVRATAYSVGATVYF